MNNTLLSYALTIILIVALSHPATAAPLDAPVKPTDAPVKPTDAPVKPTDAPVKPTDAPVKPTDAPVKPTDAPVKPTDAPVKPTNAPVKPTNAPVKPTNAPVKPTNAPVKPTNAPVKPASSKKGDPAVVAIGEAVKKLGDEYRAYLKDPAKMVVRQTSDYFTTSPSPDVTPDALIKAMERSLAPDARVDAYVKWQLMSGLPSIVDDKDVGKLIRLYSRAPLPGRHPGMDRQALQRALQSVGASNVSNETQVNAEFGKVLTHYAAQSAPMVNYRMALFQRMPVRPDAIAAGWEDVRQRVQLGAPAGALTDVLDSSTRSWMLTGANAQQKRLMHELITSVWKEADNREIQPYDRVAWDERSNLLTWRNTAAASPGRLKTLIDDLLKSENDPGGGMGLN